MKHKARINHSLSRLSKNLLGLNSLLRESKSGDMTGIMVTWDQQEIQVIDDGDFESTVVEVIEEFFNIVDECSGVTVDWRTPTRNHDSVYKVSRQPLIHLDRSRCFIDIVGKQRGGKYQIDLKPSGFEIKIMSTGWKEELTYLQLRPEGIAIDSEEQEMFLSNIPESVRKRIIDPLRNRR